jgi:hypothetical protein
MRFRKLILLFITLIGVAITAVGTSQADDLPYSKYIRDTHSDKVIIFVYGFLGDSVSTWTNGQSYWPAMITNDPDFNGVDVFVYQYPTSIHTDLTPDQVADDMRVVLKSYDISDRHQLSFVSHSMGGIVTRAYLLKNRDIANKTMMLQFYSTPTDGSSLASIGALAAHLTNLSTSQIEKLTNDIEKNYLGDQTRACEAAGFNISSYCAYEELPTFGFRVVNFESATALCNRASTGVEANHIDIVKPLDLLSRSYLIFKANLRDSLAHVSLPGAITSSIIRNEGSGTIGSFDFTGNTVIGVTTVLDNAGSVGQALVDNNFISGGPKSGTGPIIENTGRIGTGSVSNNTIQLAEGSAAAPREQQSTAGDLPSVASVFRGVNSLWLDHAGADGFGSLIGPSDNVGSMYVTDSTVNLVGTRIDGIKPSSQPGQVGYLSVWGSTFKVTEPRRDMVIPFDILNNHGISNANGTFTSGITVAENIPADLDYVTIALKGKKVTRAPSYNQIR